MLIEGEGASLGSRYLGAQGCVSFKSLRCVELLFSGTNGMVSFFHCFNRGHHVGDISY